ncbi:hypothetical protein GCM10010919_01060 [Alishewanella longhuensis]|uniref:Amidohydrolase-related domain-containing protein n=1 Tax=Alishewanella longhuensis TaxID=1091037 RepID=A0ABQ3KWP0_9ALTE|nr:hypothetical protein [Alishewanella longhuensis]GHG58953.1 hypothetical protein GCM10010919_01060 [Alishewanella longhuensis]
MIKMLLSTLLVIMFFSSDKVNAATAFINGHWYQDSHFVKQTMYVENSVFVKHPSASISKVVDLRGGFVVPPLAEAHNHNLQNPWLAERFSNQYIQSGIFYGLMMCGNKDATEASRNILASTNLKVAFASACISSSDGHPLRMALTVEEGQPVPLPIEIYDKSYIVIDDIDDILLKWPLIEASRPDIVKLMLVNSEDESRRGNKRFFGINGLKPEVISPLTAFLHENGLRVAAHVDSAADFALAVKAGVDIIAHLPGYNWPESYRADTYLLDKEVIALAGQSGTKVIATAGVTALFNHTPERKEEIISIQKSNLQRLKAAGVPILVGSDRFDSDVRSELYYLESLGVFSREELLHMAVTATVQAIWPDEKLGKLIEGYQADFLVLAVNPLLGLNAFEQIQLKVAKGELLEN